MALRIKDVCKENNITLAEVAKHLNITPVTLSQSLNGNPTLGRLQEVADAIGVDVSELFDRPIQKDIHGCVYINGVAKLIDSKKDIEELLSLFD